ncbi:MAG: ferrochelatase, partial [Actinomycetes bacterium]
DTLALDRARQVGITCVRAATVGTDPRFVSALVSLVRERVDEVPIGRRPALGPWGAAPDLCPKGCCQNPRAVKPALCGLS